MKRKIHILLIFLLLCAFLSGCGARNAAPASEEQAQSIAAEDNHANSAADRAQESPLENTPAQAVSEETAEPEETAELEETLLITITVFSNGTDDQDGIDLIVYTCDQDTLELQQLFRKKINATYPANTVDFEHGIFYFADADEERLYDNLYAYDLLTGDTTQLTDGKYAFDDLLMVDGQLYANTAREYCNAEQPARFDTDQKAFTYRNENDDDTFHASFSYDRYEDSFLIMTFQISEQRTHRVAAETHITPKTISWLSKDFQTVTPVFFTEDFEINLTRRLDKNHILMTTEPFMTGKRTLKMLDIETQEVTDVDIPGILQVYMFYPARDENTIFLIGQNTLPSWQLYRYELDTQTLTQVEFPETPRQIVDLQLTYQPGAED